MSRVTLYRRPGKSKTYYAKWRVGSRYVHKSLGTADIKIARKIKVKMEGDLLAQKYQLVTNTNFTPEDAWKEYEKVVTKKSTRNEHGFWNQFFAFCGAKTLRDVHRAQVVAWQKHLIEEGNKPVTVNSKIRVM